MYRFGGDVYLFIDEIDDKHIAGWFYGNIYSNDYGSTFGSLLAQSKLSIPTFREGLIAIGPLAASFVQFEAEKIKLNTKVGV